MTQAVRFDSYGDTDVLYLADIELPEPKSNEVRVTVKAAGINPGEASIRKGLLDDRYPTTFPCGEGSDFAGVVEKVGDQVQDVRVGDEVIGWTDFRGSHAEQVIVPAGQVVPKPEELSWEVAGSINITGVTAYAAIAAVEPTPGETVVVSAAAGGVGSIVVQLLARSGVNAIGIASDNNADWLASKGVTPVSYGDGLKDRISAIATKNVDAFIDTYGPEYLDLAIELDVKKDRINTIIGFQRANELGTKAEGMAVINDPAAVLTELARLIADGKVEIPIAETYPLADVQAAYKSLEQHHTRGKIVLIP